MDGNCHTCVMSASRRMTDSLAGIEEMSASDLRFEWQTTLDEACPEVSPSLLRLALAHKLQTDNGRGLRSSAKKVIEAWAAGGDAVPDPPIQLKRGTRLLREWSGRMHSVLVVDDGFEFDGKVYSSLSSIAKKITGAHWSGPRFFGLKRRPPPPNKRELSNAG